jgi:hypothetical protein
MPGIMGCLGRIRNGAFKRKAPATADERLPKRYLIIVPTPPPSRLGGGGACGGAQLVADQSALHRAGSVVAARAGTRSW